MGENKVTVCPSPCCLRGGALQWMMVRIFSLR
jgi:hypothetical protein